MGHASHVISNVIRLLGVKTTNAAQGAIEVRICFIKCERKWSGFIVNLPKLKLYRYSNKLFDLAWTILLLGQFWLSILGHEITSNRSKTFFLSRYRPKIDIYGNSHNSPGLQTALSQNTFFYSFKVWFKFYKTF